MSLSTRRVALECRPMSMLKHPSLSLVSRSERRWKSDRIGIYMNSLSWWTKHQMEFTAPLGSGLYSSGVATSAHHHRPCLPECRQTR